MRITQGMTSDRVLRDIQQVSERMNATQASISSGKKLTRPSDDAIGAQRAVATRGDLAATDRYTANISQSQGWLAATDTALGQLSDLASRARELAIQGASDATGASGRQAIAAEIDQIVDAVKASGNTQFNGVYVFAGTKTTTPPYTAGATDTYNGNTGTVAREIGPGVAVQVNAQVGTGTPPILGSGLAAADGGLLATLRTLSADLKAGNSSALQNGDLTALDNGLDAISAARSQTGATTNRLDAASVRLGAVHDAATSLLSDLEDTDYAEAMLHLNSQQTVYQAALRTGASIIQPSLLDFLR